MVKILVWNCNGLTSQNKVDFLKLKSNNLTIDFTLIVETHISDEKQNLEEVTDLEISHNVIHSYHRVNDPYAGICLIISKNYIVREKTDLINGRLLKVLCESKAKPGTFYNVVGFYGYTSSTPLSTRKTQFQQIKKSLETDKTNIFMGDFNFVEEALDRNNISQHSTAKDKQILDEWFEIKNQFELVDTFRTINPTTRRYTFTAPNKKSRSRIDRIYVTDSEIGKISRNNFIDTPWEDHKMFQCDISDETERGPGQWALNTALLKDPSFTEELGKQWKYFQQSKNRFLTLLEWWDRAKALVKTIAIDFSIRKKQIETSLEKFLEKEKQKYENLLDEGYSEGIAKQLTCILRRQKELLLKRSEGHRIRCRLPHFEENEPNISYYARMEKVKAEGNLIFSLYDSSNVLQYDTESLLKIVKDYYSDLFRSEEINDQQKLELLKNTNVSLTEEQQRQCDKILNIVEIEQSLNALPKDKSPGSDGLPTEFYVKMWPIIKDDFMQMVEEIQKEKQLSDFQREGIIRIIFKKEDRSDLKNYRPISLLNVDLKIITKALALRLGKVLPYIINKDQTCIPGRNIAYNLHTLNDITKYANTKNIEAAVLFLDQEKAFDRVNHKFLFQTLKHFNFGTYFRTWVKIILNKITSQVKVNGFLTEPIEVNRGVRQGDPLSALLYVLIAEVLGNHIRSNQDINGITIKGIEQKILQYADDTQIIVTNDRSMKEVFKQLKKYEEGTGAKVNIRKTEVLLMGKWKNRHDKPFDLKWSDDKVFALGLWFGNKDTSEINFQEQLIKLKKQFLFWKPRRLSLLGRAKVVNIFILSRLWYRTEIFPIPSHVLKELEKLLIDFIWCGKKHEVNKEQLYAPLEKGGIALVNINNKILAQRLVWLAKLCSMPQDSFTKVIAEEQIGAFEAGYTGLDLIKTNHKLLKVKIEDTFYGEVFEIRKRFEITFAPKNEEEINKELLFYNPRILDTEGKPYLPDEALKRIGIFRVKDLRFKKGKHFNKKVFHRIKEIKSTLNITPTNQPAGNESSFTIKLNEKWIPFEQLKVRDVYRTNHTQYKYKENYKEKWKIILNDPNIQWDKIWQSISTATISMETKSVIFSQIHLGFYSDYIFSKQNKSDQTTCKLCGDCAYKQSHWIISCKVIFDVLKYFRPIYRKFVDAEVDENELVFGLIESNTGNALRNLIIFNIRLAIHKNRARDFVNYNETKISIQNMAKQKIRQEIWNRYSISKAKSQVDQFTNFYLFQSVLGRIEGHLLILNKLLM